MTMRTIAAAILTVCLATTEALVHTPRCSFCTPLYASSDGKLDMTELSRRIQSITAADKLEQDSSTGMITLPVISFDSLLPNQRLVGTTTDPTFSRLLRDLGLGGLFVMTSLDPSKRMLRRNGVIARIEIVDASSISESLPTAVDFCIVGRRRCRLIGPSNGFVARVGRWRRVYDPDGEESMLGWGQERFVDVLPNATSLHEDHEATMEEDGSMPHTQWSVNQIDCALTDDDNDSEHVIRKAERLIPLLDKWLSLASNSHTYENIDVVATARVLKGQPGLRVDPAALLRNVLADLGERPSDPTALAFWGAALINPLPVLGVSPEIRGRILEAPDASSRLDILEWGVKRSIRNLDGTVPL